MAEVTTSSSTGNHREINQYYNFVRMRHSPDSERAFLRHVTRIYKKDSSMDLGPPYNAV